MLLLNRKFLVILFAFNLLCFQCHVIESSDENEDRDDNMQSNEIIEKPTVGWLRSAQDLMTSPTGHVVMKVAKELLNRSVGQSQVLSINLSNLLIILLLKILIFTAGVLGGGHWSGYYHNYGRADNGYHFSLDEGEDYLITGFLAAQGSGIDECLAAAACANPRMGYEYARAAKALIEGIEKFSGSRFNNPRYNDLIVLVEKAAHDGFRGASCQRSIKCDALL